MKEENDMMQITPSIALNVLNMAAAFAPTEVKRAS
jgi:hypothetical protein